MMGSLAMEDHSSCSRSLQQFLNDISLYFVVWVDTLIFKIKCLFKNRVWAFTKEFIQNTLFKAGSGLGRGLNW